MITTRRNLIPDALSACKPLSDPIRVFANILRFWISLAGVVLIIGATGALLLALRRHSASEITGMLILLFAIAGVLAAPIGLWLFFRSANRTPVLYLRSFRSDIPARRLRSLLKAALGHHFRLCGIRPPRERSSLFTRLFASGLVAMRYIGSEHFELEAHDRDWMARLLATYARSAFVFIDVRDLTHHVENEIRLSYLAMGAERCIFLVDSRQSTAEWLGTLSAMLALTEEPNLHLLVYPGDQKVDEAGFVASVRSIMDQVPQGPVEIPEKAIAFLDQHMEPRYRVTAFWHTDAGNVLLYCGVGSVFMLGGAFLREQFGPFANPSSVIGLAALIMFFVAWGRAWKQAGVDNRFRRPRAFNPRYALFFALLLTIFSPATISVTALAIYKLNQTVDYARHVRVEADIQTISTSLKMYEAMNGFCPTTEQGLQALVTLPDSEPRPTRWYRSLDQVPLDPWETQYVYRCPGIKNPAGFDLFSAGPDRVADTADDDWGQEEK